jgi:hypothetical protein
MDPGSTIHPTLGWDERHVVLAKEEGGKAEHMGGETGFRVSNIRN